MFESPIGQVTHWHESMHVATVHLDRGELKVGDTIRIRGASDDTEERISSMQLDHHDIDAAHSGEDVDILIGAHVRDKDLVFKVTPE